MKIIGFSSGAINRESNADRMVKTIMGKSGLESEFVKLSELNFAGCRGCVDLCAGPRVCSYDDDLKPYYQRIKDADAVVIGAPVYFGALNATMMSFLERFFGYRHVSCSISEKPFVVAVSGSMTKETLKTDITGHLKTFDVNVVDVVQYSSGIFPCLSCGRHTTCRIGGLYKTRGKEALALTIRPEMFQTWESHPETMAAVDCAAEKIRNLLSGD